MSDQQEHNNNNNLPPRPTFDHDEEEERVVEPSTADKATTRKEGEKVAADNDDNDEGEEANQKQPQPQRRKVNADILGSIIHQTVVANLPPGQRPMPEWKRKALEREALARGETLPPAPVEGDALYRPPHQRVPPAPLVSQQAQERSAFPGDFWFHKEIENLISKHRRKVHVKEFDEDPFYDRGGRAGRGVIASYIVDGFPLVRNARPKSVRENLDQGGVYPDNTIVLTRPGFNGVPLEAIGEGENIAQHNNNNDDDNNNNHQQEHGDDDDFAQEAPHEVQIGGGVDES